MRDKANLMQTVIGIDLGTQSIKVLFYNASSKKIEASVSKPIDLIQDSSGTAEQQAVWWLDAMRQCFAEIPSDLKGTATALSVSGQQHGFVPLDDQGNVLYNVKLWCDTTTTAECAEIMDRFGGESACVEKLGNPIMPGYTAPKILWLKKNKPDVYAKLQHILLPHDYLNFYFTGEYTMEFGDASGTGVMNVATRQWDADILRAIDEDKDLMFCLPSLLDSDQKAGTLLPQIAEELGLPAGIPIATGGGDNMMGAIGTGNVEKGIATVSLGSSGTVYAYSDEPIVDRGARLAAFCASTGGWLPLLCTMNCTLTTELMRKIFNTPLSDLESKVSSVAIGSDGVLLLPFFNGERTPNLPKGKGTLLGLDATNIKEENLLRAAMEGATYGLRLGIDALQENGLTVTQIRLTGGGSKSPTWCQMLADLCGAEVRLLQQDEGAAFGAALQALALVEDATLENLVAEHVQLNETIKYHPQANNAQKYQQEYQRYLQAVEQLTPFYQ